MTRTAAPALTTSTTVVPARERTTRCGGLFACTPPERTDSVLRSTGSAAGGPTPSGVGAVGSTTVGGNGGVGGDGTTTIGGVGGTGGVGGVSRGGVGGVGVSTMTAAISIPLFVAIFIEELEELARGSPPFPAWIAVSAGVAVALSPVSPELGGAGTPGAGAMAAGDGPGVLPDVG
jgi:hypothetical protein